VPEGWVDGEGLRWILPKNHPLKYFVCVIRAPDTQTRAPYHPSGPQWPQAAHVVSITAATHPMCMGPVYTTHTLRHTHQGH
jgi:hypothetical protein